MLNYLSNHVCEVKRHVDTLTPHRGKDTKPSNIQIRFTQAAKDHTVEKMDERSSIKADVTAQHRQVNNHKRLLKSGALILNQLTLYVQLRS